MVTHIALRKADQPAMTQAMDSARVLLTTSGVSTSGETCVSGACPWNHLVRRV